jgi:tetratricopeptide (TPR) repeat protein
VGAGRRRMIQGLTNPPPLSGSARRYFSTVEVARILGAPPARVRTIARSGVCRPARSGTRLQFSFQDLVLLRAAHGLLLADVPPRRVRHSLSLLARQLPHRPLSGVRIYADGKHVVARDGGTAWRPDSGQVVFSFDVDELARAAGVVVAVPRKRRRDEVAVAQRLRNAAAWFERALAFEETNDRAAAAAAYHRAIECNPDMADAYINLGRLVHERGDVAEANRLYHLALACAPNDPVAHYNLALALEDQGRTTASVSHYRRALALDPDFADAHFNLARLLESLGQRELAMRHLSTYKRLTKGSP